jgi:uncharacterized protein (TIGR02231 family)
MKKLFPLLFTVIFMCPSNLNAQENTKVISSIITHVTVFNNGAQVTSMSDISLPQGITMLILRGLSPYIDKQSIQVKGKGKFIVLSVSNEINYLSGIEEKAEIDNLRKKIDELVLKSEDGKMQISILKEEESFLIANKNVNGKQENLEAANFKTLFDFYKNSLTLIRTEILAGERKVNESEKELTKLRQQLDALQSKNNLPSDEVTITVKADASINAKLEINYLVQNAGWYPSYDIRVTKLNEPVSLVYKANVYQNTGVSWNNVSLTFSNASPNKSGNVPALNPYYLDYLITSQNVFEDRTKKSAPSMMEMKAVPGVALSKAAEEVSGPVGFVASENTTSIEFNVDVSYSIPSEGKSKSIDMMNLELPASFEYQTVPKLVKEAFLIAKVHDWEQYNLLQGEANLYFENTFVGKSVLDTKSVTDTMNISLGHDMGIIVKREKRKNFTNEKFIGNNKIVTLSWEISIRNSKSDLVSLRVSDQIPVSQNKEITVETLELSGGRLDEKTGFVNWNPELKPGETKNIILTYSVKYPKETRVNIE